MLEASGYQNKSFHFCTCKMIMTWFCFMIQLHPIAFCNQLLATLQCQVVQYMLLLVIIIVVMPPLNIWCCIHNNKDFEFDLWNPHQSLSGSQSGNSSSNLTNLASGRSWHTSHYTHKHGEATVRPYSTVGGGLV